MMAPIAFRGSSGCFGDLPLQVLRLDPQIITRSAPRPGAARRRLDGRRRRRGTQVLDKVWTLSDLLEPVGEAAFFADGFEKRPLHVQRGHGDHFGGLAPA